jgi:hypothetical protein
LITVPTCAKTDAMLRTGACMMYGRDMPN